MSMPIKIYSKKRRDNIMPIRVQNDLPVKEILEHENIFVMDEYRAAHLLGAAYLKVILKFEVRYLLSTA